jgi:hypothetical protein
MIATILYGALRGRAMRGIGVVVACMGLALLTGCQTVQGGPERLYTIAEERTDARDVTLPEYLNGYKLARSETERLFFRNEYIARRMYIIDVEYTDYETALTKERQEFGFASAVVSQGLSTAGAVFTPANTARTLSALASGVNSSRGFYDSELLLTKTVQIAQGHMRAQRDRIARVILLQKNKSSLDYPISAALHDLEDYYRAGTITAGLIEAVGAAGQDAQIAADQKAQAQGIPDPEAPLPQALPKQPSFAEQPPSQDVTGFQAALCLPQNGKVGPELLKAAGNFINGRDGGTPLKLTKIGKRTEAALRDAEEFVPNCKKAGFKSAYEVGALGVPSGSSTASDRVKELQTQLNAVQKGKLEVNGNLDSATRTAIAKFRTDKNVNPALGNEVDREFVKQLFLSKQ